MTRSDQELIDLQTRTIERMNNAIERLERQNKQLKKEIKDMQETWAIAREVIKKGETVK